MHQIWFKTFYLVASNPAFLFPALFALASNYYIQASIYASNAINSSLYHLCKEDWIDAAGDGGYCFILSFFQYHAYDFFFAQMVIPITFLYFLNFDAIVDVRTRKVVTGDRKWMETLLLYWFAFFNAFMINSGNKFVYSATVLVISSFITVLFISIIIYIKYDGLYPRFYTTELVLALFFSGLAVSLMFIQDYVSNELYWFIHASWHILASIGQFFLIISKVENSPRRFFYDQTKQWSFIEEYNDIKETHSYAFIQDIDRSVYKFSRLPHSSVFLDKLRNLGDMWTWTTPECKS